MTLVRTAFIAAMGATAIVACKKDDRGDRASGTTTTHQATTTAATNTAGGTQPSNTGSYRTGSTGTMGTSGTTGATGGTAATGGTSTASTAGTGATGTATITAAAVPVHYEAATARIAGARCDREISCEQVGPHKRFATRDICARDTNKKTQKELKASDCPNGIDPDKLQTCIGALAQQDCSDLVTSMQTVDACKTTALCMAK